MNNQTTLHKSLHNDLLHGLRSIELPEVQEMIRKLSAYGLAVSLPHMHASNGELIPLPDNQVIHEVDLHVSFPNKNSAELNGAIPVMWRSIGNKNMANSYCCGDPFPAGHCCSEKTPSK